MGRLKHRYITMAQRQQSQDDLTIPIKVTGPEERSKPNQESDESFNLFVLNERESHGKRTTVKIAFEVYCRHQHKWMNFVRLRNRSILLSCPSGAQADAVIRALERVVARFDGKYMDTE